jgi:CRP-like cAMP-binding protein
VRTLERDKVLSAEALKILSSPVCPFRDLRSALLGQLLALTQVLEYDAGEQLIRQGDPGDHLLVILTGSAQAFVHYASSDGTTVGSFGPGDVVGEIGLLTGEPRTADVVARTPVRALRLAVADFWAIANTHPEVRMVLTNVVANRLGKSTYDGLGGKDIHGYRVVRCVGRGGMGIVYEATRVGSSETVALKMLNHRLLYRSGALQRFRREASVLQTLQHRAIARLHDCFSAYGTEFLVMEFCDGATLKIALGRGQGLDEPAVRCLVGQLALALRYVHARGFIHRDLKPSNVIVSPTGEVKLLDFGLVKPNHAPQTQMEPDASTVSATDSGDMGGTPQYMAPEQFGKKPVDGRVDIYGLACVAYEALSGRPVVQSSDLLATIQEKLAFVLPPASTIGRGVTEEMYQFLERGLDPRPENRTIDLDRLTAWAGPVDLGVRRPPLSDIDPMLQGSDGSTTV